VQSAGRASELARLHARVQVSARGLDLRCEDAGGDRRGSFLFVVQRREASTATTPSARSASPARQQAVPARQQPDVVPPRAFRARAAEFPVAEDVAPRCVALPFFPELTEGQVAQVAAALVRILT
jgi:perosamine synthetase